jgi:copper transport protein
VPRAPIPDRPPRRVAARRVMLAWVVLAAVATLATPSPASAHAELLDASPPPNGTLVVAPSALELTFTEPIDPEIAFIDLLDAARRPVGDLGPIAVEEDGRVARVSLPELEAGVYTVTYQVVSTVDGHATTGSYAFVVDPTGTEAPPPVSPEASAPAVDARAIAARWIGLLGGLVALGSLVLWWRSRGLLAITAARPPWALVAGAAGLAYGGLAGYLWLASRPIVQAIPERAAGLPLDFAAPFGWTPFAIAMRVALAGSLLLVLLAASAWLARGRFGDRAVTAGVATLVAAATLGGMSMAAHAAAAGGLGAALVDWAHLLGVAAWLGGLPAVAVLARRGRDGDAGDTARAILRRHGPLALVAAPLVALSGIANSPLVLGAARDLVGSDYGNLLLAKAGLLSVALAIGAVNHLALRGRGRARVAVLVGAELVVAAVAVSVAATMVTIQPASARQPTLVSMPVAPAHLFGEAGEVSVHATVDLPTPGSQRFLVTVADPDTGAPRDDVQAVFLELTPPQEANLPADRVVLDPDSRRPGLYTAEGTYLSLEGEWDLEVVVRRAGALDERARFAVPVRSPDAPRLAPPPDTGIGVPAPLGVLWSVLPPGPLGWLPVAAALLALAASGAWASRREDGGGPLLGIGRIVLVAIILIGAMGAGSRLLVAAANAPAAEELAPHQPDPEFAASAEEGEAIYRANCAACHGIEGDGRGPVRTLPPAGALPDAVSRMSSAELSYRIANGLAGTPMPAFAATLTDAERWHLVRYLEDRWRRP